MTRLEVLKAEKEQIKGLRCLSFGLIDKCIEWYDKEIEAIVIHGADNKFYGQQADDPYQTDMDEAWEQAKSELMQIYMSLSEEKKQAIDVLMAQNCDQCEVGNPCLYCEHEFKAQADGEYISIKYIHSVLHNHMFDNAHRPTIYAELKRISKELDGLTVAIPPEHDGCKDCRWQSQSETEMPCKQCMHNYMDEWEKKPHWEHDEYNILSKGWRCSECQDVVDMPTSMGKPLYKFCPWCGAKMGGEEDG